MGLEEEILGAATQVERRPGVFLKVIQDKQAVQISFQQKVEPWEVLLLAMRMGIWPMRYIRNTELLTIKEQETLHLSRVAVIGTGGLGGQVVSCLSRMGIGSITLVDPDRFEESNLNRQSFSKISSVGVPKALWILDELRVINPFLRVKAYCETLDQTNGKEILSYCDVVVDALDNRRDRLILQRLTRELNLPLVHGAVAGLEGQVMSIFPEDPGLERIYGDLDDLEGTPGPEQILGVMASTAMFIGTLQANEVLKILLKKGKLLRNCMLYCDLESMSFNIFTLSK